MGEAQRFYVIVTGTKLHRKYAKISSTGYDVTTNIAEAATFTERGLASFMLGILKADDPNEFGEYRVREKIGDKLKPE